MANLKYTPKDIYEIDFSTKMRGYDKDEVDEMLDNIINDYETFGAEKLRLEEENEFLKKRVAELEKAASAVPAAAVSAAAPVSPANLDETMRFEPEEFSSAVAESASSEPAAPVSAASGPEPSNYDLIKRINRLERAVFGAEFEDASR